MPPDIQSRIHRNPNSGVPLLKKYLKSAKVKSKDLHFYFAPRLLYSYQKQGEMRADLIFNAFTLSCYVKLEI